jgi:hypothetical protein
MIIFIKIESNNKEELCEIDIKQKTGKIAPFSLFEVSFEILSSQTGDFGRVRIPCYIEDTHEPLFVDFQGNVKGVSIMYCFSDRDELK